MRYLIITTLLLTAGCGSAAPEPEFIPYVEKLQEESVTYTQNPTVITIGIYMSEGLPNYSMGRCIKNVFSRWVEINPKHWKRLNKTQREILIFHELGHCHFGKEHKQGSIMQIELLDYYEYTQKRADYLREFFKAP